MSFAADAQALKDVLEAAGLRVQGSTATTPVSPDALNRQVNGMTVLVNCWD